MHRWKLALGLLTLLVTALAACSPEEDPQPAPALSPSATEAGSPSPVISSECPEEEGIARGSEAVESSFVGDVDGDGELDPISIETFPEAESPCQAILVVHLPEEVMSTRLQQEGVDLGGGAAPSLLGVADIDGRPGGEVVVRMVSGASTEFAALYSAGGGALERLDVRGGEFGDLFPSGGSVGHLEQSDCKEPGTITISTAVPQGARYLVRRAEFHFDGEAFSVDREALTEETVDADELASGEVAGFTSGAPFGSCPTD